MACKTSTFAHVLIAVAFFLASLTILAGFSAVAQQVSPVAQSPAKRTMVPVAPLGAALARSSHVPAPAIAHARSSRFAISPQSAAADSEVVTFMPPVTYHAGVDSPWGVSIADLNGDGKLDLIVTNENGGGSVGVLLGNGDGTFKKAVAYNSGGGPAYSVAIADLDGDGKPEMVVASASYVSVLPGNGDGTFRSPHLYDSGPGGPYESYVTIADLNGDGNLDLAVGHSCGGTCATGLVAVLLGNGDGTFRSAVTYPSGGVGNYSVAVADVNGDSKPDLLVSNWCASSCNTPFPTLGSVGVLLGNGDGTFQPAASYYSGEHGTISLAVADVNGDGILDLAVASCGPSSCGPWPGGNVGVLLGKGDGTFQPVVTYSAGTSPYSIRIADVQGDGKPDILVGNWIMNTVSGAGAVSVLVGNGDGTFQPITSFSSGPSEVPSIAVGDLNGDGKPDVVAPSAGTVRGNPPPGVVRVFLNATGSPEAPTGTTLTSLRNPSVFGQSATFIATVASSSGTPSGTVQILNGPTLVESGALASGSVSIPVSTLPAGTDLVTASYLGGGGFTPSKSASLTQTVKKAATATSLAVSPNPAGTNQAVMLTATVSSQYGGATTGTVTFTAGAQILGSAALNGNVAALTTSFATAGTYSVAAQYSGDANNTGSTSSVLSEKIIAATTTTLISSVHPSVVGQAVTFTATVSSAGIPPNGETITFYNGAAVLGMAPLNAGAAMLTTSALPAGVFTITARYPGNSSFAASTSPALWQVVNATTKSATSTTLASSLNPSIYGQKVTWAAMVTSSTAVAPTGNVIFNGKDVYGHTFVIGRAPLDSSRLATLIKSNLNANVYQVTAVYSGDAMNQSSMSSVLSQVVRGTTSKAMLNSSRNPAAQGEVVTFTATITSPTVTPTGPVTFTVGKQVLGTAQIVPWAHKATLAISRLPVGSTVVTVTYLGDSNIAKSSASLTQTVQ